MFKSQRKLKAEKLADRFRKMAKVADVRASNPLIGEREKLIQETTSKTLVFCAEMIEREVIIIK